MMSTQTQPGFLGGTSEDEGACLQDRIMMYIGKYKKLADQFRKDGADEYQIERFIREEMERDVFEIENETTNLDAYRIWQSWPEERREKYLHHSLCVNCGGITSFASKFAVRKDQRGLIIKGTCSKCGGKIRRMCD